MAFHLSLEIVNEVILGNKVYNWLHYEGDHCNFLPLGVPPAAIGKDETAGHFNILKSLIWLPKRLYGGMHFPMH
jgi:hypothetical protein